MKYKIHIPTEQYGFIEVEEEAEKLQDILDLYSDVKKDISNNKVKTEKEFDDMMMKKTKMKGDWK